MAAPRSPTTKLENKLPPPARAQNEARKKRILRSKRRIRMYSLGVGAPVLYLPLVVLLCGCKLLETDSNTRGLPPASGEVGHGLVSLALNANNRVVEVRSLLRAPSGGPKVVRVPSGCRTLSFDSPYPHHKGLMQMTCFRPRICGFFNFACIIRSRVYWNL